MKGNAGDKFGTVMEGKFGAKAEISNVHGGKHTYAIEELVTFGKMINDIL